MSIVLNNCFVAKKRQRANDRMLNIMEERNAIDKKKVDTEAVKETHLMQFLATQTQLMSKMYEELSRRKHEDN